MASNLSGPQAAAADAGIPVRCCVLGTGLMGTGWAVAMARFGCNVTLFDVCPARAQAAQERASLILRELSDLGLIADWRRSAQCIEAVTDLSDALADVGYIQESITEQAHLKAEIAQRATLIAKEAVFASSSSSILPNEVFADVEAKDRCLIVHPFNPPYLIPVAELVPSAWTSDRTLAFARTFLAVLRMQPVLIRRALPGFVINRLQAAVVCEAVNLVGEGVIDAADLDRCMSDGLALRWAFFGPFATMDLNAPGGIQEYLEKFSHAYHDIGRDLWVAREWSSATIEKLSQTRRNQVALADLDALRRERDKKIATLIQLRCKGDVDFQSERVKPV